MADDSLPVFVSSVTRQSPVQPRNPVKKELARGQLAAASAILYTAPSAPTVANSVGINPITEVTEIIICNTDTVARTFTLYFIESGGAVANDRAIFSAAAIAASTTVVFEASTIMEAASTLRGLADRLRD